MEVFRTDVKAGLFILVGGALFLYSLFRVGGLMEAWQGGTHMQLVFENAQQVEPGADVYFRGIKVGRIESLDLNSAGDGIVMDCKLDEGVQIYEGTVARVADKSLLGGKMVELILPKTDSEATPAFLEEGSQVQGLPAGGLAATLEMVNEMVVEYRAKIDQLVTKADTLLTNLNSLSETTNSGILSLGDTKEELDQTMLAYKELAQNLDKQISQLSGDVSGVLEATKGSVSSVEKEWAALTQSLDKQMAEVTDKLKVLLENSNTLVGNSDAMLAENRKDLKESLTTLSRTLVHLESFSAQISERPSSLVWKGRKKKQK